MDSYIADFLAKLDKFLGVLANLTTTQIIIGLVAGFFFLIVLKVMFTKGGPRQRMKGLRGPWVTVPVIVAVAGGVAWLVINLVAPGRVHL